ncbi:MAG: hypothetical protein ACO1N0_11405 [Fluviicola sp.]
MKTCIALLSLLITGIGFSQQRDSIKTKNTRFIVKMTHGMTNSVDFDFTNSEWDRMTPGFDIPDSLKPSYSGPNFNDDIRTFSNGSYYMFSFSFINGARKREGRKFLATTNIHLGYGPEVAATKYWYHENKQIIDTLTSSQTGQEYYLTGNRNQTIAKTYRSQTIVIGVGQHIATNPARLFQFETGLDLLFLASVSNKVRASYVDTYSIEGLPEDNNNVYPNYPYQTVDENRVESFNGNLTTGLIMRIPLEISLKLSKKSPVASRMRIGAELNPGLATVFTNGLFSSNFNISGGMNFRFAF